VFNSKQRIEELEAENAQLKQWVAHFQATDAVTITQEIAALRSQRDQLQGQIAAARAELDQVRAGIVETSEIAMLQEVGVYAYSHRLEDAVAYKSALTALRANIKQMASAGSAVQAATGWQVNGSTAEGTKMIRDYSKLMLRAYNNEADNAVRTLKPYALPAAKDRLAKSRETIAKLGKTMNIRITDNYHSQRIYELELTADYLVKQEEEKERIRAERERQREDEKAHREYEAEKARLAKEQSHYESALAKLREKGDHEGAAQMEAKLGEIASAIEGVEARQANTRAGYVYVISNIGAFGEHVVKIGLTRRLEPTDRIRELGDASVPFRFDTHALIFSDDAVALEARLHTELIERRLNQVNTQREFFFATPGEVRTLLERIGGQQLLEYHDAPEAIEWRGSGGAERRAALAGQLADSTEAAIAVATAHEQDADLAAAVLPEVQFAAIADSPGALTQPVPEVAVAVPVETPAPTSESVQPIAREVAAGWYPDPDAPQQLRYWDGSAWTEHTSPA
jgi:hypothetical protein